MPHDRTFRFRVIAPRTQSRAQRRDDARRGEDLGPSTLFVPDAFVDHPFVPIPAVAMRAATWSVH